MSKPLTPDLTLRELGDWATAQAERLRRAFTDTDPSQSAFVLAQAVKLAEEVGELQAEVLGHAGLQRAGKAEFTAESIAGELADVLICTAILAGSHGIDVGKAVTDKIQRIEARHPAT